jgi:chemotaxis signal transduction protein
MDNLFSSQCEEYGYDFDFRSPEGSSGKRNHQNRDNRIVVVDIGGQDIDVIVDAVTKVLRIASDSVEPPLSVITTPDSVCLLGIVKLEGRLVILPDLEKVLTESEMAALSNVGNDAEVAGAAD